MTGKAKMILNLMANNNMDFDTVAKMSCCSDEEIATLKSLVDAMSNDN